MIISYKRKAHYHETDKMAVVHHSNYFRWMEEARVYFLEKINLPFTKMEEANIFSPVVSFTCNYHFPVWFDDEFEIKVRAVKYTGVRVNFEYEIFNLTKGKLSATASSEHCFTSKEGRPLSVKRANPKMHTLLENCLKEN